MMSPTGEKYAKMYKVVLSKQAQKYFAKVPLKIARQLKECFVQLEKEPFENSIALHGIFSGQRRLKSGKWRIVFSVNKLSRIVIVIAIKPRGDVYK